MKIHLALLIALSFIFEHAYASGEANVFIESKVPTISKNHLEAFPYYKNDSLLYIGVVQGGVAMIENGKQISKAYDEIIGVKYIGKTNEDLALWVKLNGKEFLVINGIESNKYDRIFNYRYTPVNHEFPIAYAGSVQGSDQYAFKAYKNGKTILVKDGVEVGTYDKIGHFAYSPNGEHFSYTAVKDGKWILVQNGKINNSYENISIIQYSNDSNHFAFLAEKKWGRTIVVDGVESEKIYSHKNFMKFSSNNKYLIFGGRGESCVLLKDGKEYKNFNQYKKYKEKYYHGCHIGLGTKHNGKEVILIDGEESQEFNSIQGYVFGKDSSHMIAIDKNPDNTESIYINGKKKGTYDDIFNNSIGFLDDGVTPYFTINNDSNNNDVFILGSTTYTLNGDVTSDSARNRIDFLLSKDGKKQAFVTQNKDKKTIKLQDKESSLFGMINEKWYDNKGKLHFTGTNDGRSSFYHIKNFQNNTVFHYRIYHHTIQNEDILIFSNGNQESLEHNNARSKSYASIEKIAFSTTHNNLLFLAEEGKQTLFVEQYNEKNIHLLQKSIKQTYAHQIENMTNQLSDKHLASLIKKVEGIDSQSNDTIAKILGYLILKAKIKLSQ